MAGLNVVIHCRMGIGRSSIIAAAVILHTGNKTDDIISGIANLLTTIELVKNNDRTVNLIYPTAGIHVVSLTLIN